MGKDRTLESKKLKRTIINKLHERNRQIYILNDSMWKLKLETF